MLSRYAYNYCLHVFEKNLTQRFLKSPDKAFFLAGYASSCCGSLDNWKYHATATGTIKAQLWRLESGVNYRLIAEETINS